MFVTPSFAQTATGQTDAVEDLPPASDEAAVHGETIHVEGEHGTFPPFNGEFFPSQLLWLAITFGIFYYVLQKVILPRIAGILENRRDRIALDLEAAERMKSDADEAQAAYEQELAEARERSHRIAQDARESARKDAERERAKLEAELDTKLEAAQTRIGEIKREALNDVGQIAEDVTETILNEVVRLDVPRDEVARAVQSVRA